MKLDDIKTYINATVSAENEENLTDIAWKYAIGDIILNQADQQGISVNTNSLVDSFGNEILIEDKICIQITKVQSKDITSEGDSSESQLNRKEDLG